MPTHSPTRVPKFGDWDVDTESGEKQAFTLIFDSIRADKSMKGVNPNDPAFLATFLPGFAASELPPPSHEPPHHQPPSTDESLSPETPSSSLSTSSKLVTTPKFGDWDLDNHKDYSFIFDDLKEEKNHQSCQSKTMDIRAESKVAPFAKQKHNSSMVVNFESNVAPITKQKHNSSMVVDVESNVAPIAKQKHNSSMAKWKHCFGSNQAVRE